MEKSSALFVRPRWNRSGMLDKHSGGAYAYIGNNKYFAGEECR